jgi:hypothetical protein
MPLEDGFENRMESFIGFDCETGVVTRRCTDTLLIYRNVLGSSVTLCNPLNLPPNFWFMVGKNITSVHISMDL